MPIPRIAVVVGNPKPRSRTYEAALRLARRLGDAEPDPVVDLCDVGPGLLDWHDPLVAKLIDQVRAADLVVVASPTYKATFTGLLKLFLDRFPADGLRGVVAVPLMLGAGAGHALAPEIGLRPVLVELGAVVPVRSLYVVESEYDQDVSYDAWFEAARPLYATTGAQR